jgi:transmembrane sensor
MLTHDPGMPDMNPADYWAGRMTDGPDLTAAERVVFDEWFLSDEQNQRDFHNAIVALHAAAELSRESQRTLVALDEPPSENPHFAGRRNFLKSAAMAASAAFLMVVGGVYVFQSRASSGDTHATVTGETRTVNFREGSVAYLNTRTKLRWLGTEDSRRVELISGEALFDVVHDESRPFSVVLDGSEVRVLGTRFNVYRKDSGDVVVTVLEGTVEVRNFGQGGWIRRVAANQQIEYGPGHPVAEPRDTNALLAAKWREGVLPLPPDGLPLRSLVSELRRYTDHQILTSDPRLDSMVVGGTYKTRDVKSALQSLQDFLPVQVREDRGAYVLDYHAPATERN